MTATTLDVLTSLPVPPPFVGGEARPRREPRWKTIIRGLQEDLTMFGLDIVVPFQLGWYNQAMPETLGVRIPTQPEAGDTTFAVLVGNTKKLWQPFIEACASLPELLEDSNPLETYVEKTIQATMEPFLTGQSVRCYFGHKEVEGLEGGGKYVAMQRLAQAIGVAYLDNDSHLCLHPKFGPWISLRCVLVFDSVSYTGAKPSELSNPLCQHTSQYIRMLMQSAMARSSIGSQGDVKESKPTAAEIKRRWLKWVAVRDAPYPGHPWRYSAEQLEYHYTRQRSILQTCVARLKAVPSSC